jgi:hypothetical protein
LHQKSIAASGGLLYPWRPVKISAANSGTCGLDRRHDRGDGPQARPMATRPSKFSSGMSGAGGTIGPRSCSFTSRGPKSNDVGGGIAGVKLAWGNWKAEERER